MHFTIKFQRMSSIIWRLNLPEWSRLPEVGIDHLSDQLAESSINVSTVWSKAPCPTLQSLPQEENAFLMRWFRACCTHSDVLWCSLEPDDADKKSSKG